MFIKSSKENKEIERNLQSTISNESAEKTKASKKKSESFLPETAVSSDGFFDGISAEICDAGKREPSF